MNILPPVAQVAIPSNVVLPPGVAGDNWALFLSIISLFTSQTKERRRDGHWINFHSKYLSSLLGRKYRIRINAMIATGIIESNDRYSTGQPGIISPFTKSYRLASKYRTGQSRLHELSSRPTIGKVIKAYEVDPENLKAAGIHYRSCFDQFTLDGAAATDPNLTNQWDRWTIARWFNGQEFAHRCVYGRYHSLMTQLPRHARRHLQTLGHDALSVVDVSACQPLLLGYLASQATAHATPGTPLLPYVARFSKSSVIRNTVPYDLAWWIELCESGSIYRHFYQEIQTHVGSTTTTIITPTGQRRDVDLRAYSEKQIKRASLIPIFDKIDAMKRSPIFAIILRDFPTVASFIVSATKVFPSHRFTTQLLSLVPLLRKLLS